MSPEVPAEAHEEFRRLSTADVRTRLEKLAAEMAANGDLRSQPWRAAVLATPRHLFLPRFYRQEHPPRAEWTPVSRRSLGERAWLDAVYADTTWVTQVEGGHELWDDDPRVLQGSPTCSSTMPGLVVRMLEDLDVADGHRVLEIGTGSGYSTALLCHRLGGEQVVSVEYDPVVAERAARALTALGCRPTLVVGDGGRGHPGGAPYDRIIATCSFARIPYAWIAQARTGAKIVLPLSGSLHGGAAVTLDVHSDGTASGFLHPRPLFFMPSRAHRPPRLPAFVVPRPDPSRERASDLDVRLLDEWVFRFFLQAAIPEVTYTGGFHGGERTARFRTPDLDRWASARIDDNGVLRVRDNGADPLWPIIEDAAHTWESLGRPSYEKFLLTVTPAEQTLTIPGTDLNWQLRDPTTETD